MQLFEGLNINKGNPYWYGIRRPEGGALPSTILCQLQEELSITNPNKRNFQQKRMDYRPQQEKMYSGTASSTKKKLITTATLLIRKLISLNCQPPKWIIAFLQWTFFQSNGPLNFLFILHEIIFLSFVCWICLWLLL